MTEDSSEYLNMEDGEARDKTASEGDTDQVEQDAPDDKSSSKGSGYDAPEGGSGPDPSAPPAGTTGTSTGGSGGGVSDGGGSTGTGGGASQGGGTGN